MVKVLESLGSPDDDYGYVQQGIEDLRLYVALHAGVELERLTSEAEMRALGTLAFNEGRPPQA